MKSLLFLLAALLVHESNATLNATQIAECEEGKTGCNECYITLVKCLMYNDGNVFNLSNTFFPPTQESPVFVIVNYIFGDSDNATEVKRWYWTSETSTLLHPVEGFQFFSLFFGNFQWLIGQVYFTLPIECANSQQDFFQLLTQRLKVHASTQSITPRFQDSDDANSANLDTLKQRLHSDDNLATILWIYQVIVPILVIIGAGLGVFSVHDKINSFLPKNDPDHLDDRNASAFGIAIATIVLGLFVICMDICGIVWATTRVSAPEYSMIVKGNKRLSALFVLPLLMLILYDVIIFIIYLYALVGAVLKRQVYSELHCDTWGCSYEDKFCFNCCCVIWYGCTICIHVIYLLIAWIVKCYDAKCKKESEEESKKKCTCWRCSKHAISNCWKEFDNSEADKQVTIIISISIVAVISILANHSYYIIVAFINDPIHANSIGIYFVLSILVYIFLLKLLWKSVASRYQNFKKDVEKNKPGSNIDIETPIKSTVCCFTSVLLGFLLLFQILVTSVFVILPIKRTVDDVPAQISSIYQSLFIVFGALITYRIFIKKNSAEPNATKQVELQSGMLEESQAKNIWVTKKEKSLTNREKKIILDENGWLDDKIINYAMFLLQRMHATKKRKIKNGFLDPAVLCLEEDIEKYRGSLARNEGIGVQILYVDGKKHWITICYDKGPPERNSPGGPPERNSPGGSSERNSPGGPPERNSPGGPPERNSPDESVIPVKVYIYDSMAKKTDTSSSPNESKQSTEEGTNTLSRIEILLNNKSIELTFEDVQEQTNVSDCGVFAIAYATEICLGNGNFTSFDTEDNKMRKHLVKCFEQGHFMPFPSKKLKTK